MKAPRSYLTVVVGKKDSFDRLWTFASMMDVLDAPEQTRWTKREPFCVVCPNFANIGGGYDDTDWTPPQRMFTT
jgi:hypothetical protein